MIDGVLLLGFGGPTPGCCERRAACAKTAGCEAECFVSGILGDNPARMGRVKEVTAHYHQLGGFSPYNRLTEAQAEKLGDEMARRGRKLGIACGYRHWTPWASDGLSALAKAGCREVALVVMAPHQSSVSWDWYLKHAAEAAEKIGALSPRIVAVAQPWWNQSGFIDALAARVREATRSWTPQRFQEAELIFTAHAIPQPIAQTAPYCAQFAETASLTARQLGHDRHVIGYQSAPDDSRVPWTGPTVLDLIEAAARAGRRDVVVQAAGFLVDHTEVLYDLDIEARRLAEKLDIVYTRAACVHDHPAFISLLADRVEAVLA